MIPLKDDNPTRTFPIVTVLLLAANILVFVYEASLPPDALQAFVLRMGVIPAEVTGLERFLPGPAAPLTLFTSMFLHGGLMHLAGNMLYLWIFGNNVEDEAGHFSFLIFYLVCGLAAAGAQIAATPRSDVPMIGASGAIAGVLGAYMILFPHARVLTLVPVFYFMRLMYLPAILVLGLWFLYQVILSTATRQVPGGGVAFFAHIGGFVAGIALIFFFRKSRGPRRARGRRYRDEDPD